jgi:NADPH-dependent 2,4-dienoyl-CoA reductase/sulfur reductase-like enzyme
MTGLAAAKTIDDAGNFAVRGYPLYLVGIFERGVTVYSQQIRALNLVCTLVEHGNLSCMARTGNASVRPSKRTTIAIIGGGFAGLTAAAALVKKGVVADITIFEQRDTLLPLQQGSDTRACLQLRRMAAQAR